MGDYSVDNAGTVRDGSNKIVGKADYDGQVRDSWRDKGSINNDRYTDEFGRDQGWVKKTSTSSGGGGILDNIGVLLIFGIFIGMYHGIKWLIEEGKLSKAHKSRSLGIVFCLFFPPLFFIPLNLAKKAKKELEANGDPNDQIRIAKTGIFFGYLGLAFTILLALGILMM